MARRTVRTSIGGRSTTRGWGPGRGHAALLAVAAMLAFGACDATVPPSPASPAAAASIGTQTAVSTSRPAISALPSAPPPALAPSASPAASPVAPSASPPVSAPEVVGPGPCPGRAATGAPGPADNETSTNWSGYTATSTHAIFTCVEASWVQPTIHCSGSTRRALSIWVGIGGFDQAGLEQIGTEADCGRGGATAALWHESLPSQKFEQRIDLAVRPGDTVRARIRALANSVYELSIVNVTRKTTFTVRDTNRKVRATSAEWIVEAPTGGCPSRCRILPMPDFGKLRFSGTWLTASGVRRSLLGSGFTHVNDRMVTAGGLTRATVTSTATSGAWFIVSWRRS